MRKIAKAAVRTLARVLPTRLLVPVCEQLLTAKLSAMAPADSLRLIFRLDSLLYHLTGQRAVDYDSGVHAKHRLTHYHDFFVANVKPGERVIDIGCGNGALANDLVTRAGADVHGFDLNEDNIAIAMQRYSHPRLRFSASDALQALPDEACDVVVLSNVLEHLPGRPAFLSRVCERLQPDRILIRVPLFERDWRVPLRRELGVEWRLDTTHETEYTQEAFLEELEAARLSVAAMQIRWGEIWAVVKANDAAH